MSIQDVVDLYRERQGWNDHSLLQLLVEYIEDYGEGVEEFDRFLAEKANAENEA